MEKRKRILVFEAYPFFSGSQKITLNVCKILKRQNVWITLVIVDDQYGLIKSNFSQIVDEIKQIKANEILLTYGAEDSWFTKSRFFKSVFMGLLPFYVKFFLYLKRNHFDAIYCCDPRGAAYTLGPACLFFNKKILHFHGKNRLPNILAKVYLSVFTKVICVSNDVFNSLPDAKSKEIIFNGVPFPRDSQPTNLNVGSRFVKTVDTNKIRLLYIGIIKPHKGLHHLIDALEQLALNKDIIKGPLLFILGDAKTEAELEYKFAIQNKIKVKNLESNVFWVGWTDDVTSWMKYCDYLVFPTIDREQSAYSGFNGIIESSEGLPTVLIEASQNGVFSIASRVTGVDDIIKESENGLTYDPNIETGLTDALNFSIKEGLKFNGFQNGARFRMADFEENIRRTILE